MKTTKMIPLVAIVFLLSWVSCAGIFKASIALSYWFRDQGVPIEGAGLLTFLVVIASVFITVGFAISLNDKK